MANPRDCRAECRGSPLTRENQVQIGALAGSLAVLGVLATAGKAPATRAAVAGGAAAIGAAASTLLASYVARRRCEIICEAYNDILAGRNPVVNQALTTALAWAIDIVQAFPQPLRPGDEALARAVEALANYVEQQTIHGAGRGASGTVEPGEWA